MQVVSPRDELVAVYDAAGAVLGSAPRHEVYARSLWHASAGVLLLRGNGDRDGGSDGEHVYVHRRSADKLVMAGLHDCFAGGVVGPGETPEATAVRELAEELGVTGVALRPLCALAWESGPGAGLGGAEGLRAHLFAFVARWDGPVVHQASEIAEGGWMPVAQLRAGLDDPDWPFVPDGRALARRWLDGV